MGETPDSQRVDKWLWCARFFKTRSLCAKMIKAGGFSVNGTPVSKPATLCKTGDVLAFPQGDNKRKISVTALGIRRGPASEAVLLYTDLAPPQKRQDKVPQNPKFEGKGRPTGKQRRALSSFSDKSLD